MAINSGITREQEAEAAEQVEELQKVPSGYIKIELSSQGKVGAPACFHVRNFNTEDLMDLALTDQADLPIQVVKKLQDIIWEPVEECDVKKFHEKEVVETLFIIYKNFYTHVLPEIPWELTDEDKAQIAVECGGKDSDAYQARMQAYEKGDWKPVWDINLDKVETYDIPDDFRTNCHIVKKASGFTYDYSLPKYGDVLILRDYLELVFKEKDKKWSAIKEQMQTKMQMDQDFKSGKSSVSGSRIFIPESEQKAYKEYEREKTVYATKCLKALHLVKVNGQDVTGLTLDERIKLVENPEFDHVTFKQATEALNNLKFGLKEEVDGIDPILHRKVKVNYSFRVFTLLQAIRDNDTDQATITFE